MLDKVIGSVVPLVRLPITVVEGIESVLQQATSIATRAARVLDQIEGMPARVEAVLVRVEPTLDRVDAIVDRAEPVPDRIEAVLTHAEALPGRIEKVLDEAEGLPAQIEELLKRAGTISSAIEGTVADAAQTLASVQPVVTVIGDLDPAILRSLVEQAVELLPAIRSLEQLVPVVGSLALQVDNLEKTVGEVGALLGGIPGAARLLKRGETRPAR